MKEPGDPFKRKVFGQCTAGYPSLGWRGRGTGNIALLLSSGWWSDRWKPSAAGDTIKAALRLLWLIPGMNLPLRRSRRHKGGAPSQRLAGSCAEHSSAQGAQAFLLPAAFPNVHYRSYNVNIKDLQISTL